MPIPRRLSRSPGSSSRPPKPSLLLLALAVLLLSACTRSFLGGEGLFVAPPVGAEANPLQLETPTGLPPSPTAPCDNHLVFLQDLTVPDGSVFAPGASIDKVWSLRNDGSCFWTQGYTLQLETGPAMGAFDRQPLPTANPGDTIEMRIEFFAPPAAGAYRSAWRAHDLGGEPFGVLIYIEIVVE